MVEGPSQLGAVVHLLGRRFGVRHDVVFWARAKRRGSVTGVFELEGPKGFPGLIQSMKRRGRGRIRAQEKGGYRPLASERD